MELKGTVCEQAGNSYALKKCGRKLLCLETDECICRVSGCREVAASNSRACVNSVQISYTIKKA